MKFFCFNICFRIFLCVAPHRPDFFEPDDFSLVHAKKLHAQLVRFNLFMVTGMRREAGRKTDVNVSVERRLLDGLNMYVVYNQENLIGLLACVVRIGVKQLKADGELVSSSYLDASQILEDFFGFKVSEKDPG